MFFRRSHVDAFPVTMIAVRPGERLLQIGIDDPALTGSLAAKVGLSGSAAVAVPDESSAERARVAATAAGVLVDVRVSSPHALPFESGAFDLVVVHAIRGLALTLEAAVRGQALEECRRVLRESGRIVLIEAGAPIGLQAILRRQHAQPLREDALAALGSAGFRPVRLVADREGFRFTEGLKR